MAVNTPNHELADEHERIADRVRRQAEELLELAEWHTQQAAQLRDNVRLASSDGAVPDPGRSPGVDARAAWTIALRAFNLARRQ